jgi:hypothetical protein
VSLFSNQINLIIITCDRWNVEETADEMFRRTGNRIPCTSNFAVNFVIFVCLYHDGHNVNCLHAVCERLVRLDEMRHAEVIKAQQRIRDLEAAANRCFRPFKLCASFSDGGHETKPYGNFCKHGRTYVEGHEFITGCVSLDDYRGIHYTIYK